MAQDISMKDGSSKTVKITSFNIWAPPFNRTETSYFWELYEKHKKTKEDEDNDKNKDKNEVNKDNDNNENSNENKNENANENKQNEQKVTEDVISFAYSNHDWWKSRFDKILSILCNDNELKSDVYCLQEFWCQHKYFIEMFEKEIANDKYNYSLHYLKRAKDRKPEGIAFLINKNVFDIIQIINIKYNESKLELNVEMENKTSRVGQIAILLHKELELYFAIGNTHLSFPDKDGDHQRRQVEIGELLDQIKSIKNINIDKTNDENEKDKNTTNSDATIACALIVGDFNCTINGYCAKAVIDDGYVSSFHKLWQKNDDDKDNDNNDDNMNGNAEQKENLQEKEEDKYFIGKDDTFISHLNHAGIAHGCDFIFYKNNTNVKINPFESYLYPKHLPHNKWPDKNDYSISDHRPLTTIFKIDSQAPKL